jgi:hypothetical protein
VALWLIGYDWLKLTEARPMVVLSDDEVALIKSILVALRTIKVSEIDRALVILSKNDRRDRLSSDK